MINGLRAFFRLVYFAFFTSYHILRILLYSLRRGDRPQHFGMEVRRHWAGRVLRGIGMRIEKQGTPPDYPCIVVCNHRSYIDPLILISDVLGFAVSKAEVQHWPIIGQGAMLTGTLLLQREKHSSRKATLHGIAEKVKSEYPVMLFPEGTTHDKVGTIPFRRGAFQVAADLGAPIVPAAIAYRDTADHWVGDDSFLGHFFSRFGRPHMEVVLRYGEPIRGEDAGQLLNASKAWIDEQLHLWHRKGWSQGATE